MRKHIKKGMTYILCAGMVAALLSGCSSRKTESSKPSIHIDEYTKVDMIQLQFSRVTLLLFWS